MKLLFFLLGFFTFPLVLLPFFLRYGKRWVWCPREIPVRVHSIIELQPLVKKLVEFGEDGHQLFVRSVAPRFVVRVRKDTYKRRPAAMTVEIRNSDQNKSNFPAVSSALLSRGYDLHQRATPRTKRPKDLRVRFEIDTLVPAAIASVLQVTFDAVGVMPGEGFEAGLRDPGFWTDAMPITGQMVG